MTGTVVAFSSAADGDLRLDMSARRRFAARLGVSDLWATIHQVHGSKVVTAVKSTEGGNPGRQADALVTTHPSLPLVVFTADCLGVVVVADSGVGVAHAGWRGITAGVIESMLDEMAGFGLEPIRAHIGPGIGPCCFEVGPEVIDEFPGDRSTTTWGSDSVDLVGAVRRRLPAMPVSVEPGCTAHDSRFLSHRRDRDDRRMATLVMLGEDLVSGAAET